MKIVKLLYLKFILSFSICLIASFVIFFIFSLLGNLNEGYLFSIIFNLSILNSLQIITYVPAFIFLSTVILLTIILRSKNEIIIIKSYLSLKKMMIFFLPIVFIFTMFEVNKKELALSLEDSKGNLIKNNDKLISKIIIDESNETKIITFLKNIDLEDISDAEYRLFTISNEKIVSAEYSDNVNFSKNNIIINNFTEYENDLIKNYNETKIININVVDLFLNSSIVKYVSKTENIKFDIQLINLLIFFILFLNFIFLNFLNKKFVNTKLSLSVPIFSSIIILFYYFIIFNNSLSFYRQEFEILASVIVGIILFKVITNE